MVFDLGLSIEILLMLLILSIMVNWFGCVKMVLWKVGISGVFWFFIVIFLWWKFFIVVIFVCVVIKFILLICIVNGKLFCGVC